MQKQARVTQRNIQFQDTVQIRHIPANDEQQNEIQTDTTWNPNLRDKNVFKDEKPKTQKRIVIGIILAGCLILAAVIGGIVAAVITSKSSSTADNSLSYNANCDVGSNQCISSKGLYCSNGFCSCTSPLSWNSVNSTCALLSYNKTCTSSSQCDSSLQLVCTNQVCQCNSYYTYNTSSRTCTLILNNTLTYGDTCTVGSNQCESSSGLVCTGNCSCTATKAWNVSACSCPSETFLNSSGLCETQRLYNQTCVVGSMQCDSSRGLSCNNSICICDATKYWNMNFQQCYQRLNYSQACGADSDCIPTLSCPTVSGVCNCPSYLSDYTCNCLNTQYYNPSTMQCVSRATLGGSCTTSLNYTCLTSLYCNAGSCACPSGTTWISANSTCV
ncbi:unnamed protein product [Adineta steineri]|uniref:EB domain-containing protein n=1 Tax=Adineta steineri TaxID=433720 RepID=A0A815XDX6_9BILA|nr:unnamed protein product [Adineta steineri]CAF1556378.1 unnamed protein product [Adineta steineri]